MGKSNLKGGVAVTLILVLQIGAWILSGILAWAWIEPTSFLAALVFLIAWAIFGKVASIVVGGGFVAMGLID